MANYYVSLEMLRNIKAKTGKTVGVHHSLPSSASTDPASISRGSAEFNKKSSGHRRYFLIHPGGAAPDRTQLLFKEAGRRSGLLNPILSRKDSSVMRLVIALGGNALLKRGEPMLCENQRENVSLACKQIAKAYEGNELVITHGNGPQVGLLALQNNAYKKVPMYPLDVIGAESVGMIGYMIQQELVNYVPKTATLATILTQTQVDPEDPAFKNPTKPVGPVYDKEEAEQLAKQHGWTIAPDNDKWRRVVPSPDPKRI